MASEEMQGRSTPPENVNHSKRRGGGAGGDPMWPQSAYLFDLCVSALMMCLVPGLVVLAALGGIRGESATVAGFIGGAIASAGFAVLCIRYAGIRWVRLSPLIKDRDHPVRGTGIVIPEWKWGDHCLMLGLLGLAVYTSAASIAWFSGVGETLLPLGSNTRETAVLCAVWAAAMAAFVCFFIVVRIDNEITIYRDGIARSTSKRVFLRVKVTTIFLPFEHISEIEAGNFSSFSSRSADPILNVHTTIPVPEDCRTRHDTADKVVLMMSHLVAEPNTLHRLLQDLMEDPGLRVRVTLPDSVELLRPPSLRERFRAARE